MEFLLLIGTIFRRALVRPEPICSEKLVTRVFIFRERSVQLLCQTWNTAPFHRWNRRDGTSVFSSGLANVSAQCADRGMEDSEKLPLRQELLPSNPQCPSQDRPSALRL
jgi:hypothetical protein